MNSYQNHQSHYSLKWNNHYHHILSAFENLLNQQTLVDVTLICKEVQVKAHKVVLSACSPFFQKIFSEHLCDHPVIVLNDYNGWEIQAIVDFMYKGEISIAQEQLQTLIKVAECLQVRGLMTEDGFDALEKDYNANNHTSTPSTSPNDFERNFFAGGRLPTPGVAARTPGERASPFSPLSSASGFDHLGVKLPHMPRMPLLDHMMAAAQQECQSPLLPRRKQSRPRRRSGELPAGPQDLSVTQPKPSPSQPHPAEERAENLCLKRRRPDDSMSVEDLRAALRTSPHEDVATIKAASTPEASRSPEMDLSLSSSTTTKEFSGAHGGGSPPPPPPSLSLPPAIHLKREHIENHSPLSFPPMPSVSALAMTPPHSKWGFRPFQYPFQYFRPMPFFGLDSPLGLFPPGLEGCRPLFDMPDARTTQENHIFGKKKIGRPKGQHSAPRGGPPRSWTNAELTEALQHVWNKKMTTSQASRIFGIPYNSLLMYVRGKYGKSLKLEQLRKECITGPPMDVLTMVNSNNNKERERERDSRESGGEPAPNTRPPSTEDQRQQQSSPLHPPHHPVSFLNQLGNPFSHGFYQDFAASFPIPVNMIHLLPQSEKIRDHYGLPPLPSPASAQAHSAQQNSDDLCPVKSERQSKEEPRDEEDDDNSHMFRPPALSGDDRRELVQQNGQD